MSSAKKASASPATGGKSRILTGERILHRLPKDCVKFAKDDKEKKPQDALGLDLSDLGATALEPAALHPFTKLRRLTLKNNRFSSFDVGALPTSLSYLDLSKNPELKDLSFLKGLRSLTTLILSECPAIGQFVNLQGDDFADCASLKVLVMDRCGLKGTLSLANTPFASKLETLIVSHNELGKIDLKNVTQMTKLSASHNPQLRKIRHIPDRTIAEVRLANCPALESLDFLKKKQRKLALLDLSSCRLIEGWSDIEAFINPASLLTLSLKGTPLYESSASSRGEYEEQCMKHLKCKKLRTLDFKQVSVKVSREETVEEGEASEGEDFSELIGKKETESDEANRTAAKATTVDEEAADRESDTNADDIDDYQAAKRQKKVSSGDGGLFEGATSSW